MTKFKILAHTDSDKMFQWVEIVQTVDAHSADQAIRDWYMRNPDGAITHIVAVPARSWKPKQIRTEKVERIRLTDGTEVEFPEGT